MIIVVDACALAGELLRKRGRRILGADAPTFVVAEHAAGEAQRRLHVRRAELKRRSGLTADAVDLLIDAALDLLGTCVQTVPGSVYASLQHVALRRIPADADDWPSVAVAMLLGGAIWTEDRDFFGCGCPVWRTETLLAELVALEAEASP